MVSRKKLRRFRIAIAAVIVLAVAGGIPAGILLTSGSGSAQAANPVTQRVDLQRGAVFLQSNFREGNYVVAFARHSDGTLQKVGTYYTGGGGSGSFEDSSNGLILASARGEAAPDNLGSKPEFVFAVDAGTSDIAVFRVEPTRLQFVGRYPSNGQTPVSLTVNHGLLYVLNSGKYDNREFDQNGNALENCAIGYKPTITGFFVDSTGRLTHIPGSTRSLSGYANSGCAQVGFNPSGTTLVVTERLAKLPGDKGEQVGAINTFAVNPDGTLGTHRLNVPTGISPFGFTFTRQGTLLTTEQFFGYYGPTRAAVASYQLGSNATLKPTSPSIHTGRTDTCWIVATINGKWAYTASAFGHGPITELDLNSKGLTGQYDPVASSPSANPATDHLTDGSTDISLSGDSQYLYSLNSFLGFVSVFHVNGNGTLSFVQRVQVFRLLTFGLGGEASPLGIAAY
jgi:6-phosphogluconolactonase (cycloisomerase 2 family)